MMKRQFVAFQEERVLVNEPDYDLEKRNTFEIS